jgi:hypothetical protein
MSTRIRRAVMALLLLFVATPALAGWRIGGGVADEIDDRSAGVATVSWSSEQRVPWEAMIGFIGEREREGAFERVPEAGFVALGRRVAWRRLSASASLAWVSVDNDVLSGHAQILTGVGVDFGRVRVGLRHISNGGTEGRNRGETFALVEVAL